MIGLSRYIRSLPSLRPSVWLVLQLHDEIVLELPRRLAAEVEDVVRQVMSQVMPESDVPFPMNIKMGNTLGHMETN